MTSPLSAPLRGIALWHSTWKGMWLLAVAAVHTAFAAIVFLPQWQDIVRRGVFDSVGSDPMRGAVVWFGLFGAAHLRADEFGVAFRAIGDVSRRLGFCLAFREIDGNYFRDDFAAFFHEYFVADADVEFFDLVGIVQRRALHDGSGQ